jgi:hypothetical protein
MYNIQLNERQKTPRKTPRKMERKPSARSIGSPGRGILKSPKAAVKSPRIAAKRTPLKRRIVERPGY